MKVKHYRSGKEGIIIEEIGEWVKVRYDVTGAVARGLRRNYTEVSDEEMIRTEFENNHNFGADFEDIATPEELLEMQQNALSGGRTGFPCAIPDSLPKWDTPVFGSVHEYIKTGVPDDSSEILPADTAPAWELTNEDQKKILLLTQEMRQILKREKPSPEIVHFALDFLRAGLSEAANTELPLINIQASISTGTVIYQ
ncbi:MAG: hypothetical protein GY749_40245 [Desulfobacteraceae bacterium]|nr:hypothetical protein [Desulfobacteraceae bacterium]